MHWMIRIDVDALYERRGYLKLKWLIRDLKHKWERGGRSYASSLSSEFSSELNFTQSSPDILMATGVS